MTTKLTKKTREIQPLAAFDAQCPFDPVALKRSADAFDANGANDYLSFRDGRWEHGADRIELSGSSRWAVNPHSFKFGLMEWYNGEAGAELMVPAGVAYATGDLERRYCNPDDPTQHRISPQISVDVKCVGGENEGLQLTYKTSTKGGVDALNKLAQDIAGQGVRDADHIVAVVTLSTEHYTHRKHKRKTYVPVFNIHYFDNMALTGLLSES